MSSEASSNTCQAIAGLLVPRPCGEKASGACGRCGRAVCTEHAVVEAAGLLCMHCHRGEAAPAPLLEIPADLGFGPGDLEAFEAEGDRLSGNAWSDLT